MDLLKMRVKVLVHGKVQGVGFRAWTERTARSLNLSGWVRNCADGCVEALFEGPEEDVIAMIAACKTGPAAARVSRVEEQLLPARQPANPISGKSVTQSGRADPASARGENPIDEMPDDLSGFTIRR